MLKYVAEKLGYVTVDIVSLKDRFDPDAYDIAWRRTRLRADIALRITHTR